MPEPHQPYDSAYDRVVTAMRAELENLRTLQLRIDEDIRRIERLLEDRVYEGGGAPSEPATGPAPSRELDREGGDRHIEGHSRATNDAPSPAAAVVRRAWEILRARSSGMSRGALFQAVEDTGLSIPGSNPIKNFGNLITRSQLIGKVDGLYVAMPEEAGES